MMTSINTSIAVAAGFTGNHAWVIDGHVNQSRTKQMFVDGVPSGSSTTESRYLIHCNFGWDGDYNGYYASGVFDMSQGPVDKEQGVDYDPQDPTTNTNPTWNDSDYDWWFRVIDYKN